MKRKTYQGRKTEKKGNLKKRRRMSGKISLYQASGYGIEKKFFNSSITAWAITQALAVPTGGELNNIAQGDDADDRTGSRILMKSVQVEGFVEIPPQSNQTVTDPANHVFIALVMDTQTNGAALTTTNVYSNPSTTANMACVPVRNILFSKRYRVLGIQRLDFDSPNMSFDGTNIEVGGQIQYFSMYKKMSLPVQYSAGTGAVSSIVDNSIQLIVAASDVTNAPVLSCNTQIRFTDV